MKKFIIKLLLLLCPIIIFLILVEHFLRIIPNDYSYKSQWLDSNSSKVKIWCLGSSHIYYGINPIYFDKFAFNSAHIVQGPKFDYHIFEKYFHEMDSLETVIIPISYFTLWLNLEKIDFKRLVPNYYIHYGCKNIKFGLRFKINNDRKPFNRAVKSFLKIQNDIYCSELGWGTSYSFENKYSEWEESGIKECKVHTRKENFDYDFQRQSENFIFKICSICKNKNVNVILLTTPTYHTYYELLDSVQLSKTIEFCRQTENMFDNVSYINLLKDNRFTDDDFYDADHLDDLGAKKLTLILNDTIEIICGR